MSGWTSVDRLKMEAIHCTSGGVVAVVPVSAVRCVARCEISRFSNRENLDLIHRISGNYGSEHKIRPYTAVGIILHLEKSGAVQST